MGHFMNKKMLILFIISNVFVFIVALLFSDLFYWISGIGNNLNNHRNIALIIDEIINKVEDKSLSKEEVIIYLTDQLEHPVK
mgnify:CR=1 FL=1